MPSFTWDTFAPSPIPFTLPSYGPISPFSDISDYNTKIYLWERFEWMAAFSGTRWLDSATENKRIFALGDQKNHETL